MAPKVRYKACLLLSASVVFVGSAVAQSALPPATTSSAANDTSNVLMEIIVTAQKRSENVQNVPIAITAIGSEALSQAGIDDTRTLQLAVPALNYASDSGFAQPFLRGIGSDINVPGAEPSVATFIDGVYVAQQQGQIVDLLGTDRVEVLAGPQGTLYGRNASGGAINVYTLTPSQTPEAAAALTYGNFNQAQISGHASGGLTNSLSAGLYLAGTRRDSIYDFKPTTAPGQLTHETSYGIRLKAVWQPLDGFKLTGSIDRTSDNTGDNANRNIQSDALGITLGATPLIQRYTISSDVEQYVKSVATTAILREEADVGFAQLVGVSGYRNLLSQVQNDLDATDAPVVYLGSPIQSRQVSQEIQLVSKPSSPIEWIAGVYYFHEHGGFLPIYVTSPILFQPAPFTTSNLYAPEKSDSYAGFAQATAPLSFLADGLRLTVGGRYTRDKKYKLEDTETFSAGNAQVGPALTFPGASTSWSKFTPKVTLDYKHDEILYYLTYSEGYKSGAFNNSIASDNTYVQPETLKDVEVGIKSDLFDRRLRLNFAAYRYDLKNLQVQVLDPTNGVSAVLRNAASATAFGAEFTAAALVANRLTLNLSTALEHSRYDSFPNAPYYVISPFANTETLGHAASGDDLQRAPRFVMTAGPSYQFPMPNGSHFDLDGSVYHNGGFNWDPSGQVHEPAYTLVNSGLGYTSADARWTGRLWVTNLTDKYYRSFAQITAFGTFANDAPPRMYGATVTWHWK